MIELMKLMIKEFGKGIVHKNVGERIKILISEIDNGNTSLKLREELKDTSKYATQQGIIDKDLYEKILKNYVYDI
jgi:hypothetical protein